MRTRRDAIGALLGAGLLSACAPLARAPSPFSLARAHVRPERVQEVLVGLRPYRPRGYVVAEERLGPKRVIHNYGHGGAGITLSWGTSRQAVDLATAAPFTECAVIGCGVMGLTTATLLRRAGIAVTILAQNVPPDTTSNIAGGLWSPQNVFVRPLTTEAFLAQYREAVPASFQGFQEIVGTRGVQWRRNFVVNDRPGPIGGRLESLRPLMPDLTQLRPGEHPFGNTHVTAFTSIMVEPGVYLRSLMDEFLASGGRIERRRFAHRDELLALHQPVIFNCTGLGARDLFEDHDLVPSRGQLVKLIAQPEVDYNLFADDAYLFPRSDGIVLGGTFDVGDWSLEPDPAITQRILDRGARAMARLG